MLLSDTWGRMRQSLTNEGFLHARGEQSTPLQLELSAVCLVHPQCCGAKLSHVHALETSVSRQGVLVFHNCCGWRSREDPMSRLFPS